MEDGTGDVLLETITEDRRLHEIEEDWNALVVETPDASVFLSPQWALTWWEHFAGRDRIHAIAAWDDRRLVALAPLLRIRGGIPGLGVPLFVGLGQETADDGGLLTSGHRPAGARAIAKELVRLCAADRAVISLTRMRPGSDALSIVEEAAAGSQSVLARVGTDTYPTRELTDELRKGGLQRLLKRNDVRRRRRRLEESHEVTFSYHEPGHAGARLEEFLAVHDKRWSSRTDRPSGLFSSPDGRAFLRDVAPRLDEAGWLRITTLRADQVTVAARFGFEKDGVYFGLKSGFDPAFERYGPGHLVMGMLLQELLDRGARRFDFMRGGGAHKDAWADSEVDVGSWVLRPQAGLAPRRELARRLVTRRRYRQRFGAARSTTRGSTD